MSFYSAPKYIAVKTGEWDWTVCKKATGKYSLDPEHYVHFVDANSEDHAKEIADALNKVRDDE